MKKLSVLLVLSLMMTNIYAQKDISERATKSTEKLTAALNLTPEQQVQVKELYMDKFSKKQMKKAQKMEQTDISKADRKAQKAESKAQRKALNTDFESQLNAILTPEQVTKKDALKAEKKEKRKNGKSKMKHKKSNKSEHMGSKMDRAMTPEKMAKRADKATERMSKRLQLNDKQKYMVNEAYNKYYKDLVAQKNDGDKDQATMKQSRKAIEDTLDARIDTILNDEQKVKWAANKEKRQGKGKGTRNRAEPKGEDQ